jgi:hypothetical protein
VDPSSQQRIRVRLCTPQEAGLFIKEQLDLVGVCAASEKLWLRFVRSSVEWTSFLVFFFSMFLYSFLRYSAEEIHAMVDLKPEKKDDD